MKIQIYSLLVAALALVGCEAGQNFAEQKVQEAQTQVQAEATQAIEGAKQDALKQVDPTGEKQALAAKVQEAQAMLERIQQGEIFSPEVRKWIEDTLANSNATIQAVALPVIQQAHQKFPESRKWLEDEVKKTADQATGAGKQVWQDLLDNWSRLNEAARAQ